MLLDSDILDLIIAFASYFLQIIDIVQRLMQETVESILLVLLSIFTAGNV